MYNNNQNLRHKYLLIQRFIKHILLLYDTKECNVPYINKYIINLLYVVCYKVYKIYKVPQRC